MSLSRHTGEAPGISPLATMMKVQAVVFFIYGLPFFLNPSWSLQTIFGLPELPLLGFTFARALGGLLCVIAVAEYLIVRRLSERLDLVWAYVALPGILLLTVVWEGALGALEAVPFFFWSSVGVTVFFAVVIGVLRARVKST